MKKLLPVAGGAFLFLYLCTMKLFRLAAICLLFFNACNTPSPPAAATNTKTPPPPVDPALLQLAHEYDQFIQSSMRNTHAVGAAVAIVKDSTIILLKGYGLRNARQHDSVNINTVFRIGSLSKGFTGVLTGILVQKGLFHWDDKVIKYVPSFNLRDHNQALRVEIRHLLSHTTGLPYHAYTNLIEEGLDIAAIRDQYFPKSPVCGKEGDFYAYQNAAFCITGQIMQSLTGQSYSDLLRKNILDLAGMSGTSSSYEAIDHMTNKALPHVWTGSYWQGNPISPCYYNAVEAGGINSNITDMAQWLKILLGNRPDIVTEQTLDQVFAPVVKTGNERRIQSGWIRREEASYAMGWRVLEHEGDTFIYHGGYVDGFRGEIAFNRRDNIGICMLFNGETSLSKECIQVFFEKWKQLQQLPNPSR